MSATLQKRPLTAALQDARDFCRLFPRECWERWQVAGSVRRKRHEVGDVEHVIIPAFGEVTRNGSLWPERVNLLWHHLDALVAGGQVQKHFGTNGYCWGERQRRMVFRNQVQEIFTADADNWGAQLAIRTGPGEYSRMLVTHLQRHGHVNDLGYVWDKRAITCARCGWFGPWEDLATATEADGAKATAAKWTNGHGDPVLCPGCRHGDELTMARVSVPDEEAYFRLCGVPFVPPEERGPA